MTYSAGLETAHNLVSDNTRRNEKYLRYDIRELEEYWGVRGLEETRRHSCEDVLRRSSWQHLRSNDTCYEPVLPTDYHNLIKYTRSNPFTPAPELSWPITRSFLTWPLGPVVVLPPTSSKFVAYSLCISIHLEFFYILNVRRMPAQDSYIFVILQKKEKVFINFERQVLSKSPSLQVKNTFKPNLAV